MKPPFLLPVLTVISSVLMCEVEMGFLSSLGNSIMKPVSALLKPVANVTGDIFNRATGQEQANQWQWDMWNAQNEYNAPAAQRARLEAAGYNPMLMNSVGSSASGQAGSMTSKSGSGISPFEILSAIVSADQGLAQADLIKEQAKALSHDNKLIERTPVKSNDNSFFGKTLRLLNWSGTDEGQTVINRAKEKVGGIFQGAAIPKSPERVKQDRVLKDDLIKRRPGQRLDDAIKMSEVLAGRYKTPQKKPWTGVKRGKYSDFAP